MSACHDGGLYSPLSLVLPTSPHISCYGQKDTRVPHRSNALDKVIDWRLLSPISGEIVFQGTVPGVTSQDESHSLAILQPARGTTLELNKSVVRV